MRVLSRRRKFAKAVACGYSEGAGFVVLTEPSFSCRPFCSTHGRPVDAALTRCVPRRRARAHSAVPLGSHSPGASRVPFSRRPGQRRDDGVGGGHSSVARCATGAEPVHSAVSHTQLGPFTSHPHQQQRQARRRRRGPAEDSSRRRRRALPRAGDGCCRLVVSVTGPEAMGTAG